MCEPISIGAVFASVGSAFKFADLAVRIAEVGTENEVFVRTIRVVRDDLNEVERLLKMEPVQRKLAHMPGKDAWVRGAIHNTGAALNDIGRWVERARAEQQSTGSIQFNTRMRWILNDHEKLLNRKTELMTCHQQLSNVLHYLIPLEDTSVKTEPQTPESIEYFDDILSRHKRKKSWNAAGAVIANGVPSHADYEHRSVYAEKPVSSTAVGSWAQTGDAPSSIVTNYQESNRCQTMPTTSVSVLPTTATPLSPPPSYASVVRATPRNYVSPPYDKLHDMELADSTDRISCRYAPTIGLLDAKSTWAYRSTQVGLPVPELAGDTVCFSATNSLGPVNPFELCATSDSAVSRVPAQDDKLDSVTELLGDITFAVELPVNDSRSPLGRIPGVHEDALRSVGYTNPDNKFHGHRPDDLPSELPAVSRRRPVPSPRMQRPVFTNNELPATFSASALEMPSSDLQPCFGMAELRRSGYGIRNMAQSREPQEAQVLHQAPRCPESASSARMRRQKQIMHLLGSINP